MPRADTSKDLLKPIHDLQQTGRVTVQRLSQKLGKSRQFIHFNLNKLIEKGLVTAEPIPETQTFHYRVTDDARINFGLTTLPLQGQIAAGEPVLTLNDDPYDSYAYLQDMIGFKQGDYLLRVVGESMIGIGIYHGDHVIIRPDTECQEGDVVAVCVMDENSGTLKRWYTRDDEIMLVSENPVYSPIIYKRYQVKIQGLMVGRLGGKVRRKSFEEAVSGHVGDD